MLYFVFFHSLQKVVKNTRDEVTWAFTEVLKEFKRLQAKVMDFIDQEEKAALLDMGNSIQRRHEQLADLKKQKLWLTNLLDDPSDFQFLQVKFTFHIVNETTYPGQLQFD